MTATLGWLRKHLPGLVAVAAIVAGYFVVSLPTVSAAEQEAMASKYSFAPMSIALPASDKQQTIRPVNKEYDKIRAWISSVGAAIALNDLDGDGLSNDICLVDPRTDQVVVTPAPGKGDKRYAPFALDAAPLPMNEHIAPMGCVPGDFNEDGRIDLLVYYWGRTPITFLAKAGVTELDAHAYIPAELVPGNSTNGKYTGAEWNTNSATVADFDGDGHADIFIGNYFPDSPVLDDTKDGGVTMNHSMSHALNSGRKYILLCHGFSASTVDFTLLDNALPGDANLGWTLGSSATDIDGDLLPELYIANDFGVDRLLYNESTPGHVKFVNDIGVRTPGVPKSKRVGHDSFKGMGVDFGDLDGDGRYDMYVSNITTPWGIEESNFQFMNTARDTADMRAQMSKGEAPFKDVSGETGTAWSGWGWDVKIADFNNSGQKIITQATGFVKGQIDRWPNLQELATSNDALVSDPTFWPNAKNGDDIGGNQTLHFWAKSPDGRYADIAPQLGLAEPVPTRGIATGDTDGDGLLDFAVARQYAAPVFYHNTSPSQGTNLNLQLIHDGTMVMGDGLHGPGSPAIGAEVTVTTPDGRKLIDRVDGGSGHSGKRSHDVNIGLGNVNGPVQVHLAWRDTSGQVHQQDLQLTPGRHCIELGSQAKEVAK